MKSNFFILKANHVMTLKPKLINENELVSDALDFMNKNKITCLFVVNENKKHTPIGIIHIHDCIRNVN